jgi:hypothetical protein
VFTNNVTYLTISYIKKRRFCVDPEDEMQEDADYETWLEMQAIQKRFIEEYNEPLEEYLERVYNPDSYYGLEPRR